MKTNETQRSKAAWLKSPMLALTLLGALTFHARAQSAPPLINYQGRLTDSAGVPLPAGNYSVAFRLWDRQSLASGQTLVWGREHDMTIVESGAFNVILGGEGGRALSDSPPPAVNDLGFAFGESNRFLGLTITRGANGQAVPNPTELVPRQQILSAPFAIESRRAETLRQEYADTLVPPGTIVSWMGTNNVPPSGWEFCSGQEVSRTDTKYARLFNVLGTSSGAGDGSTTFHLPDLRGVFLRGVDGSAARDPDSSNRVAANGGGNTGNGVGSFQADELMSHTHSVTLRIEAAGGGGFPNFLRNGGSVGAVVYESSSQGGAETRPKNVYVHYIIKF